MKKFNLFLIFLLANFLLFFSLFSASCKRQSYSNYLTELRSDIFIGECDQLKLKATYGFTLKERNSQKAKYYCLQFTLLGSVKDFSTYTLIFNYNDLQYKSNFNLEPTSNTHVCQFEIANFKEKSFTVEIALSSERKSVSMNSILPDKTLSPEEALNVLWKSQPELMNSYVVDGDFNASLIERIIVKEGKPYYYVGIRQREKLIAFLLDGYTGEQLAVRNVF